MNQSKNLPIYERFFSWQGEGFHQGLSAYFIRTYGCPIKCSWCDSAGTWHSKFTPKRIKKIPVDELVIEAAKHEPNFVVITGGEPTIYNLNELTKSFSQINIPIHLETSGAFKIRGHFNWITVSPKEDKLPLIDNINMANEIKIIVDEKDVIAKWIKIIPEITNVKYVWLHPEWSKRNDPQILNAITNYVKNYGAPFRAGYQIHKIFSADRADENTMPNVPLGGKINLGS